MVTPIPVCGFIEAGKHDACKSKRITIANSLQTDRYKQNVSTELLNGTQSKSAYQLQLFYSRTETIYTSKIDFS